MKTSDKLKEKPISTSHLLTYCDQLTSSGCSSALWLHLSLDIKGEKKDINAVMRMRDFNVLIIKTDLWDDNEE